MPNHAKCSHPWTVYTSRLLMSQNSINNVLENLPLMSGRGKTQNRAKTHRPSISAFSAIFVLKENGTQSHSAKFRNWGDHLNSVPDLAASPPWWRLFVVGYQLFAVVSNLLSCLFSRSVSYQNLSFAELPQTYNLSSLAVEMSQSEWSVLLRPQTNGASEISWEV